MDDKERKKERYKQRRERLMADPEKYQEYLERRRLQRKLKQAELQEEPKEEPKFRPPLSGESTEQTRAKYNRKTEKAIKQAERDMKTKWDGLHRFDAAMKFIRDGMPDDEVIKRIGLYKDYEDGTKHPDKKLLKVYKNVAAGKVSKGHYGMSLRALIRGELDGEAGKEQD